MTDILSASDFSDFPPKLYNMGGLNPHNTKKPLFWAGFDWLTINCQVTWKNWVDGNERGGVFLRQKLTDLAEAARESGESVKVPEWEAKIAPGGGKIGGVKYCKFKI